MIERLDIYQECLFPQYMCLSGYIARMHFSFSSKETVLYIIVGLTFQRRRHTTKMMKMNFDRFRQVVGIKDGCMAVLYALWWNNVFN